MDLKKRKKYFNRCDPYETPSLESGEVLDIDNYEIEGRAVKVRGKHWAKDIAKKISWSDAPQVIYFTGYPGSGKTTELKRVERILSAKDDANLLSVYINALDFLPINDAINEIDIFSTIIYKTIVEVAKYQGKSEDKAFEKGDYFDRLWNWLSTTDVTLKSAEIGVDSSKIVLEMKNNENLRHKIKMNINDHPTKFKRDVDEELYRLNKLVQNYEISGQKKNGILIIFDSLEHNRGVGSQIDLVADNIEKVFANRDNLALPIDVIYTIPPYLSTRQIKDIDFLPVVKIITKEDKSHQDGIEVMKSLVYERIPKEDLAIILGNDEFKLEEIIKFSGGYPRDLLKLLQKVIMIDDYPVNNEDIEVIFKDLENEYQENIPMEYKEMLLKIYETKELNLSEFDNRNIAHRLFGIHVILRYRNGDLWFSLNPPTKRVLGIKNELK